MDDLRYVCSEVFNLDGQEETVFNRKLKKLEGMPEVKRLEVERLVSEWKAQLDVLEATVNQLKTLIKEREQGKEISNDHFQTLKMEAIEAKEKVRAVQNKLRNCLEVGKPFTASMYACNASFFMHHLYIILLSPNAFSLILSLLYISRKMCVLVFKCMCKHKKNDIIRINHLGERGL